ncbi:MAG: rhamnogalacturonan acetylesterase [Bacteroidaceae bacterium]|nr:rhamnogalacturonan acetylesterase [Bacteroidaceae bacterium]
MKRIGWLLVLAFNFSLFTFAQQGLDANGVHDLTLDSLDRANQVRPVSGSSRRGQNPVLFLVGNSTMRNGTLGNGNNGQWGWGYFCHEWFDEQRVTVENHALGGTSPRTFYRQLWPAVLKGVEAGDFVVLELGHNDNGPVDEGRARSSIQPALADDSLLVTIKETGRQEWVYTFGGYVRRFVNEIRAKGATPILLTLTPRNAYTDEAQTVIDRKLTTFTPWIRALASELHTPLIDLNDLSATKLEHYGRWKADYHFFGDKIHSSAFGARMNAASFAEGLEQCNDPQVALLKQALLPEKLHPASLKGAGASGDSGNSGNSGKSETSVSAAPTKKKPKRPTVFLTGDSTVKNSDADPDGMWGWGAVAYEVFDSTKCTVINAAKAGRSTRTFLEEGRWDAVYNSIEPGDYVLIQFGHNDIGPIDAQKERGTIATAADTCHVYHLQSNGQYRVVYSFGWYLKKFIGDVRERGGIPVLVSLTPRNEWPNGKIERRNDSYGRWYRQVAEETGVEFIDLHNLSADRMDKMGRERAAALFNHDHTHSSLAGARHTARCIAKGIKQQKSPLRHFLK